MKLNYDYSTKNFHRYATTQVNGMAPREIYISRSSMPQPIAAVDVQVTVADGTPQLEKVKPARA